MIDIIFIWKNDFPASFQIFAGNTKNAQISNIQNIFIDIAISKLVNMRNDILTNSQYFWVAFDISKLIEFQSNIFPKKKKYSEIIRNSIPDV